MVDVSFHPGARDEFRAAYAWYHERGEKLAESFEAAVDSAVKLIAAAPGRFSKYDDRHRCYLLRRFPYSIIYRIDDDEVVVMAVAHAKRKPGYWSSRESLGDQSNDT